MITSTDIYLIGFLIELQEMEKQLQSNVAEVNEVRTLLQTRISELEPYVEQLKTTEARLSDSQERAGNAERQVRPYYIKL